MTHPRNLEIAALSGKPNCKGLNLMSVKIFSVLSHRACRIKIKTRGFWLMLANFPVLSSTLAVEVGLIWQQLWFVPHFGYHTIILSCFKAGWAGGRATKLVLDRLSATTNLWHHDHSSLLAYQLLMLFFFFKKKRCLHNLHFWLVLKQRGHFIILWHKIIVTSSKKRSVFGNVFTLFHPDVTG